ARIEPECAVSLKYRRAVKSMASLGAWNACCVPGNSMMPRLILCQSAFGATMSPGSATRPKETAHGFLAHAARRGHELHVQPAATGRYVTGAPERAKRDCAAHQGLRLLAHGLARGRQKGGSREAVPGRRLLLSGGGVLFTRRRRAKRALRRL